MRLMWVIFLFVFSFDELLARSITNKRSTSSFDTSFFDNFHQLFGFYEVPPPKSDASLGPSNPSDQVPESPQSSDVGPSAPQPTPSAPQPTPSVSQPTPSVPQPTYAVPQPTPSVPQPTPSVPQPSQPAPVQPSPSVPQPSQPAPVQPPPKVAQLKPVQPSVVTEADEPVQPDPVVVQPASDPVQVPIQPLAPKLGEPVNLRNFDPVASVQPQPAEQPPFQPQQTEPLQPAVQPLVVPQSAQPQPIQPSFQPPVQPQAPHIPIQSSPAQPSFQPQPIQSPPAQPSFQAPPEQPSFQSLLAQPEQPPFQPQPVQSPPAQPSFQSPPAQPSFQSPPEQPSFQSSPAQPPFHPQPVQSPPSHPPPQPAVQSPPSQPQPVQSPPQPPVQSLPAQPPVQSPPSTSGQPVAFPPALPNKPSSHQGWTGAPQRQPYYAPPRPYGPQPWWRRPSPIPTIPQNLNSSHPSQPKYVSSETAIPNKNKDIKVGIPNKTPDLRPARPLPPFHMEPSPFPLPREECITAQGELGECASYFSCGQQGGRPRGLCHLGHDVSSHARTCCVYPSFCGYQTNREVTYFKNPNYPNVTSHLGDCLYRVNLLPGVCQVRVDFMDFLMKPMKHGECEPENSLGVTSNDENAYIPVDKMCGILATGDHDPLKTDIAHMYVNVDDDLPVDRPRTKRHSRKTLDFKVNINNHPTRWNLRISQIQCDGANLQAPQGCAQYYNQNKGNITSFNLLDGAYANNMDLALCIKRDPAACAIHYRIHSMGVGPTKGGATGKTQLGYGLTCEDYLIFNGEKTALCGSVSAGTKDIILPVKGEQGLTFRTDSIHIPKADTGFHIEYEYIHNCKEVEFYKYPTPGRRN